MGKLAHLIDPRFLPRLIGIIGRTGITELELRDHFLREVPNRNLGARSLNSLLEFACDLGLISKTNGLWILSSACVSEETIRTKLRDWVIKKEEWSDLLEYRVGVYTDLGMLSSKGDYAQMCELAARSDLSPTEWTRIVSGHCDLRQITGRDSKHSEADFFMLYRQQMTIPITNDVDLKPRISQGMLPVLPTKEPVLLASLSEARASWWTQVNESLGSSTINDLAEFISFSKNLLDLLLWGELSPLRSQVSQDKIHQTSDLLKRLGVQGEHLIRIWKVLPSLYRHITRLSWGVRYLGNNLSVPIPTEAKHDSFLRICNLDPQLHSRLTMGRSGQSLTSLVKPLRTLERALLGWSQGEGFMKTVRSCTIAVGLDQFDDKLARRYMAERVKCLGVLPTIQLLDAFTEGVKPPPDIKQSEHLLELAQSICVYNDFLCSRSGSAYAELRLALHAELDFRRRFNVHELLLPRRYYGIWESSLASLISRAEDKRKSGLPATAVRIV